MIVFILGLMFITCMMWLGFHITGALLSAVFWLFIKIPLAIIFWGIAVVCCCTLILIPVGIWLFKAGISLLVPGHLI